MKLKAISTKFEPDELYVWRSIQRDYCKTFFVPLNEVEKLDHEKILLDLYENQLESLDLDEEKDAQIVLDNLYKIEDPNYDRKRDEEEEEYNRKAELEEQDRQKKIAAKKAAKEPKKEELKELPKQGGINLGYLSQDPQNEG